MAGYSGTPLVKKLGIKPGWHIFADDAPSGYQALLAPLPDGVTFRSAPGADVDMVHLFTKNREQMEGRLNQYLASLPSDAVIWVSWPKKASGVPSDVTEDVIREVALPLGLVDVKVCAVDDIWSGLKLVVRLKNR